MTIMTVPYAKLRAPSEINAREEDGYDDASINELAALIASKGLIQSLAVRPAAKGMYEVMAGRRRFLAIGRLIEDGRWPIDLEIPVTVRDETLQEALETSLIENIARKPMHPVQELEVFASLFGNGDGPSVATIAARYGVTERHVQQTLALGGLHPDIRAAWKDKEINRDTAEAFSICPDQKKQVAAFRALKKQSYSGNVTRDDVVLFFKKDRTSIDEPKVMFVGLDAYEAAGGKLVSNFFGDGYIENDDLLNRLYDEKLAARCDELVADGWSWAVPSTEIKNGAHYSWARLTAKNINDPARKKRIDEIDDELKSIPEDDYSDEAEARHEALSDERDVLSAEIALAGFSKKQKAESGCILTVSREGRLQIQGGYLRNKTYAQVEAEKQKARKAKQAAIENDDAGVEPTQPVEEEPGISQKLLEDITGIQTEAVIGLLSQYPAIAVRIAAAALSREHSYENWPVRLTPDGMKRFTGMAGGGDDDDMETDSEFEDDESKNGFGAALAAIPEKAASQVLAAHLGRAIDMRQIRYKMVSDEDNAALVGIFPGAAYLKAMRELFDAKDFFERASGKIAIAALEEMGATPEKGAKKPSLVAAAVDAVAKTGWLPKELRHPDYALFGSKRPKKAA